MMDYDRLKGKFLVLDGPDGSGKTTQFARLVEYLKSKVPVCPVREPGGTYIGERLRELLLETNDDLIGDRCELLLFMAARAQLVEEIIAPALNRNSLVISDRFVSSSFAYQGGGRGIAPHHIMNCARIAIDSTTPDLTIILYVDSDTARKRMAGCRPDRIERACNEYHERVREAYKDLCKLYPQNNILVDASRDEDEVFADIVNIVENRLANNI